VANGERRRKRNLNLRALRNKRTRNRRKKKKLLSRQSRGNRLGSGRIEGGLKAKRRERWVNTPSGKFGGKRGKTRDSSSRKTAGNGGGATFLASALDLQPWEGGVRCRLCEVKKGNLEGPLSDGTA